MKLTQGAIGNLVNRYRAVLRKCHLLNTFGSLAVAGMLIMGSAGMAQAAEPSEETAAVEMVVIDDVDAPGVEKYTGTSQTTLVFNDPTPSTFNKLASGFGAVQANYDVSVANLCTGVSNGAGTGIFAETTEPITVNVSGAGVITVEHVDVANNQTLALSGTLVLANVSGEGDNSELIIHDDGRVSVKDGGILDLSNTTDIRVGSNENIQISAGGTLIIDADQIKEFQGADLDSGAVLNIESAEGASLSASTLTEKFGSDGLINIGSAAIDGLFGGANLEDGTIDYESVKDTSLSVANEKTKKSTVTGVKDNGALSGGWKSAVLDETDGTLRVDKTLQLAGDTSESIDVVNGSIAVQNNATLVLGDAGTSGQGTVAGDVTLEKTSTLNVQGNGGKFTVKGSVGGQDGAAGTVLADGSTLSAVNTAERAGAINVSTLSVKNGGTVQAGDSITVENAISEAAGSIVAQKDITVSNNDISKADNATLTLNAGGTIKADSITATNVSAAILEAGSVTVDGGALNLKGTETDSTVKNLSLGNGTQANIEGTLKLKGADSVLAVGSQSDKTGGTTLAAQTVNLNSGMLLIDPAWDKDSSNVAVMDLGAETGGAEDVMTLGGKVGVGQNSYLAIGTKDTAWLPGVAGVLSKDGTQAALGLYKPITIKTGQGLVVNGALMGTSSEDARTEDSLYKAVSEASNSATFASNTLLVVNGKTINGKTAAITFEAETPGTLEVAQGAELLITDAADGQKYIIVANVETATVAGWKKSTSTDMLSVGDAKEEGKNFVVTVTRNEASTVFPGLSGELAGAVNALYSGTPGVNSEHQGVRFLSRATDNFYLGADKGAAVEQMESAARMAFAAAVPQMTKMASDAATNSVVNRMGFANPENGSKAMNVEGQLVDEKALGLALWIAPLWSNQNGFGMEAGNLDYGYNANLGGVSLGADYTWASNFRAGLMFNIGGGYAQSSGDVYDTTNSMTFWGLGAYAGWKYENFAVMGDVSYTSTWNSVEQELDQRMKMGDLEADIQASALSAGLRGEYKFETSVLDIIPHVGVRYMSINTWGYDVDNNVDTVLENDGFQQSIWTFPVGVTFSREVEMNSDWYFKPSVDFTVIPAAGDIKAREDVCFTGLNRSIELETQMMDYFTWQGGIGLEFGNENMSVGVNYTLQAGQNSTGHGVFGMFRYEF